ncbi:ATP synthase F1 subunit epsilon [Aerococcaceae bacterium WGS1372]
MSEQKNNESNSKLSLTIITPRGVKFEEEADMIILRTIQGEMGILANHAPVTTILGDGVLRIMNNGFEKNLAVFGGVAEISGNHIQILSTIAQRPDEIDIERAEEDQIEAQAAIQEEIDEQMTRRLEVRQIRALIRLRVSQTDFFEDDAEDNNESDN